MKHYILLLSGFLLAGCNSGGGTSTSNPGLTVNMVMESQIYTQTALQPATPYQTSLTVSLSGQKAVADPAQVYTINFQSGNGSLSCASVRSNLRLSERLIL